MSMAFWDVYQGNSAQSFVHETLLHHLFLPSVFVFSCLTVCLSVCLSSVLSLFFFSVLESAGPSRPGGCFPVT